MLLSCFRCKYILNTGNYVLEKVVKQKRKTGEANVPMFMLCVKVLPYMLQGHSKDYLSSLSLPQCFIVKKVECRDRLILKR